MRNNNFSMLELLSVIFVIALLFVLLLPSISRSKMMANNILCRKNLKDIHSLASSYATDHDNTLPGRETTDFQDLPPSSYYYGYAGHLIPYIDPSIHPSDWVKKHIVDVNGNITGSASENISHTIMKDAIDGVGPFRMFYCPEVIQNIKDPNLYYLGGKNNIDVDVPKVNFLRFRTGGNPDNVGLPTTYLSNDDMMHPTDPVRISQMHNFGQKLMFIEGGVNGNAWNGYGQIFARRGYNSKNFGFRMVDGADQTAYSMLFTFPHDDEKDYWRSSAIIWNSLDKKSFNLFNDMCAPEAYVTFNGLNAVSDGKSPIISSLSSGAEIETGVEFITHLNPLASTKYLDLIESTLGSKWKDPFTYIGDEIRFKPGIGKTNILYGDGRVSTEHISWLFVNRAELLLTSGKTLIQFQ